MNEGIFFFLLLKSVGTQEGVGVARVTIVAEKDEGLILKNKDDIIHMFFQCDFHLFKTQVKLTIYKNAFCGL